MEKRLDPLALGYSLALLSAICMLTLGILGNLGVYNNAMQMMQSWHMYFSPSIGGIIAGMLEAAILSFLGGYLIAVFYNKTAK